MGENKESKVKLGTVINILIIFILLLLIGGLCWYIYSIKNTDTTNNSNILAEDNVIDNTINNNESNSATVDKIDNTKDWVYSSYSSIESFDGSTVYIPTINIDSNDAKEINEKIKKMYTLNLRILYEFYINGDILSIVLIGQGNSWDYSEAYNIDIYTGKAIDNYELLQYKNIATQDLLDKLPKIYYKQLVEWKGTLEEYVEENTGEDDSHDTAKKWYQTLEKFNTEAIDNFDINKNYMYMSVDFKLNLIIEIDYPEGSKGLDSYIVNTRM